MTKCKYYFFFLPYSYSFVSFSAMSYLYFVILYIVTFVSCLFSFCHICPFKIGKIFASYECFCVCAKIAQNDQKCEMKYTKNLRK